MMPDHRDDNLHAGIHEPGYAGSLNSVAKPLAEGRGVFCGFANSGISSGVDFQGRMRCLFKGAGLGFVDNKAAAAATWPATGRGRAFLRIADIDGRRIPISFECPEFQHSHDIAKLIGAPPDDPVLPEMHPFCEPVSIGFRTVRCFAFRFFS